jgi:tRNA-dihydrouridine synthase B
MRIGSIQLKSNLFLSPLAGYTNLPFRLALREIGGLDFATTDLVNARSLLERNQVALQLAHTRPEDQPIAVQLFGSVPEEMRDAAVLAQEMGAAAVDVNMGCPVPKVCRVGGGSAMMTEMGKTAALIREMVDAVKIPVTAKMRLGWDDQNLTAPELSRVLEDAGVAAIFVHGRTREQGFSGKVNLGGIRSVVEAVREIPVIGNGDVTTPDAARVMLAETGCAGVSIGRGAFYNPWIFRQTAHYLATGQLLPEATFEERKQVICRHLDLMIDYFGEARGCRMFRRVAKSYSRRFGPNNFFNRHIAGVKTKADFHRLLNEYTVWRQQFLDDAGELLPRFRPNPLKASFLEPGEDDEPVKVAVPRGPVEVW